MVTGDGTYLLSTVASIKNEGQICCTTLIFGNFVLENYCSAHPHHCILVWPELLSTSALVNNAEKNRNTNFQISKELFPAKLPEL